MSSSQATADNPVVVMKAEDIAECVRHIARDIYERTEDLDRVALLGILRRGRPLADRIARELHSLGGVEPLVGSLATTLYRDDVRSRTAPASTPKGQTHFDFDVNGRTIILVDDVIFAGRTARAALDEVMDYGRPDRVQLACLVDRGLRDLPIQPDYLGRKIDTARGDHVAVHLEELDGEDVVILRRDAQLAKQAAAKEAR